MFQLLVVVQLSRFLFSLQQTYSKMHHHGVSTREAELIKMNATLDQLNDENSSTYTHPIIYVSTVMAFGILGNGFVLIIYTSKIRKPSNYRLYVLTLAVLDIIACATGIPGLIFDMRHPYTFTSHVGCKLLRYGYHVTCCASSMTHLLVGIERNRKICKPLRTQISQSISKLIILFIFILAFVIAVPACLFYGIHTFSIGDFNITATQCHVDDKYHNTSYPFGYDVILLILVITVVVGLCVCYIQIGLQLLKSESMIFPSASTFRTSRHHTSKAQRTKSLKENKTEDATKVNNTNLEEMTGDQIYTKDVEDNDNMVQKDKPTSDTSGIDVSNNLTKANTSNPVVTRKRTLPTVKRLHHMSKKTFSTRQMSVESRSQKITLITFVMTVIFAVSYIPYLTCVIVGSVMGEIRDGMSKTQEAWFQIGTMSYVISNAANPYVYFAMDKAFRSHCINILCCLCFLLKRQETEET